MSLLALQDLLYALSSDAPLGIIMHSLCCEIERVAPEIVACTLTLDENKRMHPLASPSLPDSYNRALDGVACGPEAGTCGVSMTHGRPHLTYDIEQDPNWNGFRHLIRPLGLRTCWSHPIMHRDGRVLGSLAFYFRNLTQPSAFHEELAKVSLKLCTMAFEHEEAQNNIQKLAYFDALTGLPNRAMIRRELKRVLAEAQRNARPFAVVFIDLDNFKGINDKHGHLAGDEVLRQVSRRLEHCVRTEEFAGRLSGDEFLVIIHHSGVDQIDIIADRIRESLHQPLAVGDAPDAAIRVTASLGISFYPDDGQDIDTLLNNADTAMYKSKNLGKNQISFFQKHAAPNTAAPAVDAPPFPAPALEPAREDTLYGPSVHAMMQDLSRAVAPVVDAVTAMFYDKVSILRGMEHLINCLSPEQLQHLKAQYVHNLILLCSPDLTLAQHRGMALRSGRIHAIVGVPREHLTISNDILQTALHAHLDIDRHNPALTVLSRRLIRDLAWQMAAAQALQTSCNETLLKISHLCWTAENYTDLITKASAVLIEHDGIDGCAFMRPDEHGVLRAEALAGDETAEMLALVDAQQNAWIARGEDPAMKPGSTMSAWNSGNVERTLNCGTDPRFVFWNTILQHISYTSIISLPLMPPSSKKPMLVLSIYGRLPGGFSSPEQDAFFTQIRTLLIFGINKLETFKNTAQSISHTTRQRWRALLHGQGLEMYYQPITDPRTGQVKKAEALARLRDGDKTLLPATFFPALTSEDFFTLFELGLNQALRQRAVWAGQGLHLDMSVNLPASALGNPSYAQATRQALNLHACPPHALTLEILETEEIAPGLDLLTALDDYKDMGVRLAEDDLGSGYSTLVRLREMPFDVIKIDRSIVCQADKDPYSTLRFIYQLTRLGHSLGKQVVVEGVEAPSLLQAVARLGPNCVQGYAVAQPLSAKDFDVWLSQPRKAADLGPQKNNDALVRLADTLIWEEVLHVIYAELAESQAKNTILDDICASMLDHPADSLKERALRADLVRCAHRFGLNSPEYVQTRDHMICQLLRSPTPGLS